MSGFIRTHILRGLYKNNIEVRKPLQKRRENKKTDA